MAGVPSRPKLEDGLVYAERDGKHLFLNPAIPDWLVVNRNAALLLSKSDGQMTYTEIAASCGAQDSDVESLFRQAAKHGIVGDLSGPKIESKCGKPEGRKRPRAILPQLKTVHWKLTNSCNLRCRYCYAESGRDADHMSLGELLRVTREVAELSPSVEHTLSGGEPLLHPDVMAFAETLKSWGNRISLLTNGTLIDDQNAKLISKWADRIKVSLDGSTEGIHAITRGYGNHAAAVNAIDLLTKCGADVQVAMTVHRGNIGDIDPMTRRFGARLTFQPLFQAGRGADWNDLALSGKEYYDALASTENVAPMAAIGTVLENLRGRGATRCALAESEISISETGDVYPCQLLSSPEFAAGNVRVTPLAEIFFNSAVLAKARSISVDTLEKCRECPVRLLCAGGCRARDFYEVGSIEEVGNFCEYELQAFLHGLFDTAVL